MTCCGKFICSGCCHAPVYDDQGNEMIEKVCPFCRIPVPSSEEKSIKREEKRVEANDAYAIYNLGIYHYYGRNGYPQDNTKALELWHRASELGCTNAYNSIGLAYQCGRGTGIDEKKAKYYHEQAALKGDLNARFNLGLYEAIRAGNMDRAIRHYIIAVRNGHTNSLREMQELYSNGHATKEDYTTALRSYQTYLGEIKSKQRDEAASADEDFRYY